MRQGAGWRSLPIVKAVRHLEAGEWRRRTRIVQKDASSLGCWAHGIVHLIEGDLDNAQVLVPARAPPVARGNTANAEIAALKATLKEGTQ